MLSLAEEKRPGGGAWPARSTSEFPFIPQELFHRVFVPRQLLTTLATILDYSRDLSRPVCKPILGRRPWCREQGSGKRHRHDDHAKIVITLGYERPNFPTLRPAFSVCPHALVVRSSSLGSSPVSRPSPKIFLAALKSALFSGSANHATERHLLWPVTCVETTATAASAAWVGGRRVSTKCCLDLDTEHSVACTAS